ncbi:MAG: SagB/ThcOx family dehydrogenase [Kiritimatiellae bacterium]|nr:SagB/ThcOx family dehydrogenase [Kiritimatiellia bacterium]
MKTIMLMGAVAAVVFAGGVASAETLPLPKPIADSGVSVMEALKNRHSTRDFQEKEISDELLSGVLWAADGFNRPDKRTHATALNKQTIRIYVCRKSGAYLYDAKNNALEKICDDDLRPAVADRQTTIAKAPVALVIAADLSDPLYANAPMNTLTHYDAGIVSANIYLYCAANGLGTVCRGTMDKDALKKALKLPEKTIIHLNHPIGYPAQ